MLTSPRTSLAKILQLAFVAYLVVALFYTTNYVIVSPVSRLVFSLFGSRSSSSGTVSSAAGRQQPLARVDLIAQARQVASSARELGPNNDAVSAIEPSWTFSTQDNLIYWEHSHASHDQLPIREETFLSKAFSQSMHPTRIIPFYYKATGIVDENDVTITTLVTSNRYKVLKQLVERYKGTSHILSNALFANRYTYAGPISVTIHIPLPSEGSVSTTATHQFVTAVRELDNLYMSSAHFATYVDVHLALSPFSSTSDRADSGTTEGGRQFNVWRNVARLFARSAFVMMLDVDFAICTDWRSAIRDTLLGDMQQDTGSRTRAHEARSVEGKEGPLTVDVIDELREGRIALVLPAFEYVKQEDGLDQSTFPRDKEVCRVLVLFDTVR